MASESIDDYATMLAEACDYLQWALDELVPVRRTPRYMEQAYGSDFHQRYDAAREFLAETTYS